MCFMPKMWTWSKPLGRWNKETTMAQAIEIIRNAQRQGEVVLASPCHEDRLESRPSPPVPGVVLEGPAAVRIRRALPLRGVPVA